MIQIFNRKKLRLDRDYCATYSDENFLRKIAANGIVQRLNLLDINSGKSFKIKALEIGAGRGELTSQLTNFELTVTDSSCLMLDLNPCKKSINIDDEDLDLIDSSNDLILSCLNLHWINDVEGFLHKVYSNLKPSGFFVANFIGGRSLRSLRKKLIDSEILLNLPSRPHISPFISIEDATALMKRAGFASIVSDFDILEVEYPNCLGLMRELKNLGESNKLIKYTCQTFGKSLYLHLKSLNESFTTEFEIITICGKK
jgi:SAM-dependent methyltransferase